MPIEAIIEALAAGRDLDAQVEALEALHGAERTTAVTQLASRLGEADAARRKAVFFALQHCWDAVGRCAVIEMLSDPDPETRRMAAIVLARGEGREFLAHCAEPLLRHPDPEIAGGAFELVESMFPDPARLRAALRDPGLQPYLPRVLSRYYAPALSTQCRALLDHPDLSVARAALAALIEQNDRTAPTRARLRELLQHDLAEARELAAEYFTWHGGVEDVEAIGEAMGGETDLHARAALAEAVAAIGRRKESATAYAVAGADLAPLTASAAAGYRRASRALRFRRGAKARRRAFDLYRTAEPLEPRWLYEGRPPGAEFLDARAARFEAQQRVLAMPPRPFHGGRGSDIAYDAPVARRVVAPVRGYEAGGGESFGEETGRSSRVFTDLVHVGDDVAWDGEHLSVVALADGLVREVACTESWGNLVVIEHILPSAWLADQDDVIEASGGALAQPVTADGAIRCCSLYAHLGPYIAVRPREPVQAGRKIGSVGRAFTWENGGYRAHLHFGVHLGPYRQHPRREAEIALRYRGAQHRARVTGANFDRIECTIEVDGKPLPVWKTASWVCGYLPLWWFEARTHGWLDPRRLLAAAVRM